ncbi:MAG: asparagine synthase-related protein [Bacteroidota bacterium]
MLHLTHSGWTHVGRAYARGHAFDGDCLLDAEALAAHLNGPVDAFGDKVERLEGEFAAVVVDSVAGTMGAAVDRIRSIPLFYAEHQGDLVLSDDAWWLAEQTGSRLAGSAVVAEYLLQGLTVGPRTLAESVRQLQAGERLEQTAETWSTRRYALYGDGDPISGDLETAGLAAFETAFERLLASVGSRPLAVPLSGGLDSRLVAFMLARAGRRDVLCYTYGRADSFETQTSRRVAEHLGLPWAFVPYTNARWHAWFSSDRYQAYRPYASQLTAIEHEQDWPALLELLAEGRLSPEAIVVPGHSGDFLAGSHLPAAAFEPRASYDPADWVWSKYFRLWPQRGVATEVREEILGHIRTAMDLKRPVTTASEATRRFEQYGWQERQAKMIVNSVRAYENHELDWRVPLWGPALQRFWPNVPLAQRRDKRLYIRLLTRLMGDLMDIPYVAPPVRGVREKLNRILDLDYARYGMYLGPTPLRAGMAQRVGRRFQGIHPTLDALVQPVRHRPLQTLPLNAITAALAVRFAHVERLTG